jgi:hypothetical protein
MLRSTLGAALIVAALAAPAAARAATPAVVTVGDSAISGEAGRWAGNTNGSPSRTDALGPTAYYDNASNTAETIPGCHRSKSAEAHIGIDGDILSANFACSGARTYTYTNSDGNFKPGLDFYDDHAGHIGQALALQQYAATHTVKAVVVLIDANNYGFADIVQDCVEDWLLSPSWWKNYCQDDSDITSRFTSSNINTVTTQTTQAYLNIRKAMANDGYADGDYTIFAQTYWSPIPDASGNRYPETGLTRQSVGGCGMWNKDENWANATVVTTFNNTIRSAVKQSGLTNVKLLDMQNALLGHRLCENTVGLLEDKGLASWRSAGAADKSEWVEQIRTVTTLLPPYQLQEDGHADYWGQLAMRNCLRQAFNGGATKAGACVPASGLDAYGEPNMTLKP